MGKQWHAASEEFRKKYEDRAAHLRKVHKQNHPEYQYNPRKASDRKRRMTKAKKAQLVQIIDTFADIQEDGELTGEKASAISAHADHQATDTLMGVPADHVVVANGPMLDTQCQMPVNDAMLPAPNMNGLGEPSRIFADCPSDFFEKSFAADVMPSNSDTAALTDLVDQATGKTQSSTLPPEQNTFFPHFWSDDQGEVQTITVAPTAEAGPPLVSRPEMALMEDISGWLTADLDLQMEDERWCKELENLAELYDDYE